MRETEEGESLNQSADMKLEGMSEPDARSLDRLRAVVGKCLEALVDSVSVDTAFGHLVDDICGSLGVIGGALLLFEEGSHGIQTFFNEPESNELRRFLASEIGLATIRNGQHPMVDFPLEETSIESDQNRPVQRSVAVVPLSVGARQVGLLLLASQAGGELPPFVEESAEPIGEILSPIIALGARIAHESRMRTISTDAMESITRLQQVSQSLAEALTPREVASTFIRQGVLALDATAGMVAVYDQESDMLELIAALGIAEELVTVFGRFPSTVSYPLADAVRTGEMVLIQGEKAWQERYPAIAARIGPIADIQSWAAIPLAIGSRIIGVVGFGFGEARNFEPHDRFFLSSLAEQCALALDRATIFDSEQRSRADVEAAHARLALIAETSEILAASMDYRVTLTNAARLMVASMADWCIVDLIEPENRIVRVAFVHADEGKRDIIQRLVELWPPNWELHSPVVRVLISGEPLLAPVVEEQSLRAWYGDPDHAQTIVELGVGSMIVAPLRVRERTLGAITLARGPERTRYAQEDLALALDLAHHAALAVDNSRLYTETERAVRRKDESIALLDTILATAPVGLAYWDEHLHYVAVNQALARMNGVEASRHIGKSVTEMFPEASVELLPMLESVLESGIPVHDHEYRTLDLVTGRFQYRSASYYPVRSADGKLHGVGGVVTDITERKWAEDAIRESEERYRVLVEMAPDVIYSLSAVNGAITELSPAFEKITGWGRSDWIGKPFVGILHPDDLPMALTLFRDVMQGMTPPPVELRIRAVGGNYLIGEFQSRPLFDDGRVIGEVGIARDITERKRAHEALLASELRLSGILATAMDAIITISDDGEIILFNRAAEHLFGCAAVDAIGQPVDQFLPRSFGLLTDIVPRTKPPLSTGAGVPRVSTAVNAEGTLFPIEATISAGEVNGQWLCTIIVRDITERHQAELDLQKAKSDAENANNAKDQFLAILSHELRTPLTPVLSAVQALEEEPDLSEFVRMFLEIIHRNVELEARLIDDLLDLTRIARGKIELDVEVVDLHALLSSVLEICADDLAAKHFQVPYQLNAMQHHVVGDSARLQQVFWNLIKNAVKFTPEKGMIAIATSNDKYGNVIISVEDTGIGIEAENLDRIFDAFDQGGLKDGHRGGGLGLGLAISKALVDMHHGTLSVWSAGSGKGTTFTVLMPTIDPSADRDLALVDQEIPVRAGDGLRILLVDDHPDTSRSLAMLLRRRGYEVTIADSVASALEMGLASPFDLLVSDIGLPDGTGHDVIQNLRKKGPVKGIALSGFGMEEDIRRSLEAGFDEHLIKPVNFTRLQEAIQRLAGAE